MSVQMHLKLSDVKVVQLCNIALLCIIICNVCRDHKT